MRTQCTQGIAIAQQSIAQAVATLRARRAEKGQSLVELALVLPIFVLLLMAAGEFGLALREQTNLTQVVQQAAHYLADHPASSTSAACTQYIQAPSTQIDNTSYGKCSADIITSYLKQHGFPDPSLDARVTFGLNDNQQQDTITVTYPFQVVLPLVDRINLCPSRNSRGVAYPKGSLCVGATVSVIAATEAPTITDVEPGSDGYLNPFITWTAPYNPSGVNLSYNVYSCYADDTLTPAQPGNCKYDDPPQLDLTCGFAGSPATWQCEAGGAGIASPYAGPLGVPCSTANGITTCYGQDLCNVNPSTTCGSSNYAYEITAVQPDPTASAYSTPIPGSTDLSTGIESPRSPYVYGPPLATNGP